jgi:putative spermidine/putrescine transport system permease protein
MKGAKGGSWARLLLWFFTVGVLLYLAVPLLVVLPISFSSSSYLEFPPRSFSFQWYEKYFFDPSWTAATLFSFKLGLVTMLVASLIGTLAAFGITRGRFRGKTWFQVLILSPMIIPVIVISIATYSFFAKLKLIESFLGLVIGHSVVAVPFVFINVSAALLGFDVTLEKAASSLGANRLRTFLRVTFPLIRPGILTGALFAFIISFDELIITMFISGTRHTLPVRMWMDLWLEIDPTIAAVSSFLIVLSMAALLSAEWIRRQSQRKYDGTVKTQEGERWSSTTA